MGGWVGRCWVFRWVGVGEWEYYDHEHHKQGEERKGQGGKRRRREEEENNDKHCYAGSVVLISLVPGPLCQRVLLSILQARSTEAVQDPRLSMSVLR